MSSISHQQNRNVLYISYDGILEPLGQSQVLRYLEKLAENHQIFLISFEKKEDMDDAPSFASLTEKLKCADIRWMPLRYHKKPSAIATAFDILQGVVFSLWVCIRNRITIVHARSYVPAVIALILKKTFGIKFIFDMRGFWVDERVDGGIWSRTGRMYHVSKWFERHFLLNADCVVSLTQAAVDEMKTFTYLKNNMPRFELITTCADLELFKRESKKAKRDQKKFPFTLGYVGSVGVWYQFETVIQCFKILKESMPEARLHVLNRGDHNYIQQQLTKHDVLPASVLLEVADHQGVAKAMQDMDAGIFFYKQAYSKKATSPTKLGEFLGCGVPCIGNKGVGDLTDILERDRVGVALADFSEESMRTGIHALIELAKEPGIQHRCRQSALRHFSLEDGVKSYNRIYQSLSV